MTIDGNGIDLMRALWICKSWTTPVGCMPNIWFVPSLFNIHDYSSYICNYFVSHVWNMSNNRVIWISHMWFGSHKQNNRDMWWVIMNIKQWSNKPKISNATHRSWSRFTYPNRSHQINSISINTHQIRTKPVTHKLFPNFCFHRKIESNWNYKGKLQREPLKSDDFGRIHAFFVFWSKIIDFQILNFECGNFQVPIKSQGTEIK